MKFAGICLVTENVPALVHYYKRLFGGEAQGDDTHSALVIGDLALAIFSRAGMEQMAPGSMRNVGAGRVTIAFEVEDVDAEFHRLSHMGIELIKPVQTHPWGARAFWFRDLDGNIIDLFSRVS
jgi:uncharacterized glyoxalase superfamily protein PhnB